MDVDGRCSALIFTRTAQKNSGMEPLWCQLEARFALESGIFFVPFESL